GNISETRWKNAHDNIERSYNYNYDELNRLKKATFRASINNDKYTEGPIAYDKNGNIISLTRNGQKSDNSFGLIDNLAYTYFPYSNRLKSVIDDAGNIAGFNNGTSGTGDDYKYDASGNMTKDLNKNIGETPDEEIAYNYLNLPTKVIVDATHTVEYTYDAAGSRLQKKVTNGSGNVTTTLYAGGFLYENSVLQYFGHTEGYARRETSGSFSYIYQYKDHLGNVRLAYWKNTQTNALEIISTNNYYAFGMEHKGYGVALSTNPAQKIKFNSKELQDELQLNWYDYQARNYDSALGRWFNIDPLAETSRRFSPYTYALNNPIYFIDPDGMQATGSDEILDTGDFEVSVDIGYGRMRKTSQISGSISYSGADVKLSKSGQAKFDRAAEKDQELSLRDRFQKDKNGKYIVDPDAKPDFSDKGIQKINGAVTGLADAYKDGGKPEVEFYDVGDTGDATTEGIVKLNRTQILTNYRYASVLFHEYRHQWQYISFNGNESMFTYWERLYSSGYLGDGGVWARIELDAYAFQYRMGDHDSEVHSRMSKYFEYMVSQFWNKKK
ncbi:RHS repeat-associated core domain-containing protein, partial [Flavobacterium zepuense]